MIWKWEFRTVFDLNDLIVFFYISDLSKFPVFIFMRHRSVCCICIPSDLEQVAKGLWSVFLEQISAGLEGGATLPKASALPVLFTLRK